MIRFRFTLRSLLIAVAMLAIVAAWAGYYFNWVRQRHAALASGQAVAYFQAHYMEQLRGSPLPPGKTLIILDWPTPPWPLTLFGDSTPDADSLWIDPNVSDDELRHIAALFPELGPSCVRLIRPRPIRRLGT